MEQVANQAMRTRIKCDRLGISWDAILVCLDLLRAKNQLCAWQARDFRSNTPLRFSGMGTIYEDEAKSSQRNKKK